MNMKTTEASITEYIKTAYTPLAIILNGSRANGMAKENSDWDIFLITVDSKKPRREIYDDANIEYHQTKKEEIQNFKGQFELRTENTKVLYDPENLAVEIIKKSDELTETGNTYTQADKSARKAFLRSSLSGIKDYADNPMILFDKKIDFYSRITGSWFRFLKNQFEPSHYFAFPIIEKEDPYFYSLLQTFVNSQDADVLNEIGKKLFEAIFKD